jgi:Protein of unknown function with HXXEE motif
LLVPAAMSGCKHSSLVPRAATLGLFAAWVVHDLEELLTMATWTRHMARRLPWVRPMSQARVNIGIILMGVVVVAGAVAGARSSGRSGFYQAALTGFGWHALGHLLSAVALHEYTPGLVTAPLLVAPFSLWAWGRLARAGVPRDGRRATAWGALLTAASLLIAHRLAAILTRHGGNPASKRIETELSARTWRTAPRG